MVLDFAKEAIQNAATHSINFDELRAGKARRSWMQYYYLVIQ